VEHKNPSIAGLVSYPRNASDVKFPVIFNTGWND
jgi:hypothetical protein